MPPKMPEGTLKELVKATTEARETIRELHEARATLLDVDKKQRERITNLIVQEVTNQVTDLGNDARTQMRTAINTVIDGLAKEWKGKLGIE